MIELDTVSTMDTAPPKDKEAKKGKSRVQLTEGTARWLRMRAEFEDMDVDHLVREMVKDRNIQRPMTLGAGISFEPNARTALYSTLAFIVALDVIVTIYSGLAFPSALSVVFVLDLISIPSVAISVIIFRIVERKSSNAAYIGVSPTIIAIPLMLSLPFFMRFPPEGIPFVLVMLVGTAVSLSFYVTLNLLLRSAKVDITTSNQPQIPKE